MFLFVLLSFALIHFNCSHSSSLLNSTAYTETIMGNLGSVFADVDGGKSCVPLSLIFLIGLDPGLEICLEAESVEPDKGENAAGKGGGKICALLTIEGIDGNEIIPFGANGRTKFDFDDLEDEEDIAEQCVSVNQLPLAVVANPGMGFFTGDGTLSLAYADKVAFFFTEDEVVVSILGEVSSVPFIN